MCLSCMQIRNPTGSEKGTSGTLQFMGIPKRKLLGALGIPRDSKKGIIGKPGIPREFQKGMIGIRRDSKNGVIVIPREQ